MAAIGGGLESYAALTQRLERALQDDFDRELLGCLRGMGEARYEALVTRARGLVAQLREHMQHPDRTGHDLVERYRDDCERLVLSYLVLAQGVGEDNLFRFVTFMSF